MLRFILVLVLLISCAQVAIADPLRQIREEIRSIQAEWGIPGMAVGIIRDGEVVFAEGFGSRDLEGSDPVDSSTLFRIGSCSKALTALSIGVAYQRGELAVDKPVRDTIPDFELPDESATGRATVGDLLTHQSGLGRYSLLSHGSDFTRAEICDRVRHLPSAAGFRERFVYSNLNYALAAHVLEVSTGRQWEEYVEQEIFSPLGMDKTCFTMEEMIATGNFARPNQKPLRDLQAPAYELRMEKWSAFNPAGGVISNLDELLNWLQLCLGGGQPLLETPVWEAWLTPYIGRRYSESGNFRTSAYGFGWNIYDYRGHHLVYHSGIVSGYCANVSFMPHEGIGIVVLTNLKHHSAHDVLPRVIYDRLLGLEPYDHQDEYMQIWKNMEGQFKTRDEGLWADRIPDTNPSLDQAKYVGRYENPVYGTIEIIRDDGMVAVFNDVVTVPLEHFHYDVWASRDDIRFEFSMLGFQFQLGPDGNIEGLMVREEMTGDPIRFGRLEG
jgi:CubicO group peptidase (beta-lactamase class C family)